MIKQIQLEQQDNQTKEDHAKVRTFHFKSKINLFLLGS
jgi:hypothetical protein